MSDQQRGDPARQNELLARMFGMALHFHLLHEEFEGAMRPKNNNFFCDGDDRESWSRLSDGLERLKNGMKEYDLLIKKLMKKSVEEMNNRREDSVNER